MNRFLFLLISLFSLMFACSRTETKDFSDSEAELASVEEQGVDDQNPIQLQDLDGNDIPLSQFEGKTVFLNFWATWCKPCIAEMPSINKAKLALEADSVVFLAASDQRMHLIKPFAEKYPFDFQYAYLKPTAASLGITLLPTTYLINSKGEIVEKIVGAREWHSEEWLEKLRSIN